MGKPVMTLENAIEGFWLAKKRNLSSHTVADYSLTFRRLCEFMQPGIAVEQITGSMLNQFLDSLIDDFGIGAKTLLNAWIALSSLWTWAEKELGIVHVVRKSVQKPRPKRPVVQEYTAEEVRRLLEACATMNAYAPAHDCHMPAARPSALRDRAIIVVLLDGGLRAQELCDLLLEDYDAKRGSLLVRQGKGNKQRVVFLGDTARRYLWRYLATRTKASKSPLFATREGRNMEAGALRRLIVRIGERSGVDGVTLHRFRHTFAINFLRNGGNLFALQELLGHASLEMVRRYARLAERDLQDAQRRASVADGWRL